MILIVEIKKQCEVSVLISAPVVDHNLPITPNQQHDGLADYSPKDAIWDKHRSLTDAVSNIYLGIAEFERLAARMDSCAGYLGFGWGNDLETGESRLKLRDASFCRVRHCPNCQWRRSLMWIARFYQSLPAIEAAYPKARWLFLTLTVKNCAPTELKNTIGEMNKAWKRLTLRKEFKPVTGWIRTTELTRGKDGSAHPHFHALLMVPPSWFSGQNYVRQDKWIQLWGDCMRLDYLPNVDIRAVKQGDHFTHAIAETLKYAVKPADMVEDAEWFLEITRQCHKLRFIATGGALKDVLRVDDESDSDLALMDGVSAEDDDGSRISFNWRPSQQKYRRFPKGDKPAVSKTP